MIFAILGFLSKNSMSKRLAEELRSRGHDVYSLDSLTMVMRYCTRRLQDEDYVPLDDYLKGLPAPLSAVYEEFKVDTFDVVFLEQSNLIFKNDLTQKETVVYYHRDLPGTFNCLIPDLLLYRFKESELYIPVYHRREWHSILYKTRVLNGVQPSEYKSDAKKKFKGLGWIGLYRPLEYYMRKDAIQHDYYEHTYRIKEYVKEHNLGTLFEATSRVPFSVYKHILERLEACLIIPGRNAYVTRKCYEAAICRSLIVLWVQNDRAKQVYKEWGLVHEENCIMFTDPKELEVRDFTNDTGKWDGYLDAASNWAIDNHTYVDRCDKLLRYIEKVKTYKEKPRSRELIKIHKVVLANG